MWIEYDLKFKGEVWEKGLFNTDHLKSIQVERHGGGYGRAIELYYDGHDTKCVFITDDDEVFNQVYDALKRALASTPADIKDIGYIRPLQRPFFNDETTLIPSAYQGEELPGAACCSVHAGDTEECKD